MMTCQKSIFLHLFPFLTFPETSTRAFLPNYCYSQTFWVPVSLILHVDHFHRGREEADFDRKGERVGKANEYHDKY